jgi:hypothetical protein
LICWFFNLLWKFANLSATLSIFGAHWIPDSLIHVYLHYRP